MRDLPDRSGFPDEVLKRAVGISAAQRPADEFLFSDSGILRNLICVLGRHAEGAGLMRDLLRIGQRAAGIEAKAAALAKIAASAMSRSALFLAAIRSLYDNSS